MDHFAMNIQPSIPFLKYILLNVSTGSLDPLLDAELRLQRSLPNPGPGFTVQAFYVAI